MLRLSSIMLFSFLTGGCQTAAFYSSSAGDQYLRPCGQRPNCVSTNSAPEAHSFIETFPVQGSGSEAISLLANLLEEIPGALIIVSEPTYLRAEVTSRFFRFVDDLELLLIPDQKQIHLRSASRLGYSDLGVNRRRLENLRKRYLLLLETD